MEELEPRTLLSGIAYLPPAGGAIDPPSPRNLTIQTASANVSPDIVTVQGGSQLGNLQAFAPPGTLVEGDSTGNFHVASFTGVPLVPRGGFTAVVAWGDGQTSTLTAADGSLTSDDHGNFDITSSHVYAEEGPYRISVRMLLPNGNAASATSTSSSFTVQDALGGLTVHAPTGAVEGSSTGAFTIASFTDGGGVEPASDFSAVVQWGDGQTSTLAAGAISANGSGGFDVVGSHTYAEEGTYSISVVVQDNGGATVAATGPAFAVQDALGGLSVHAPTGGVEGSSTGNFIIASFTDGLGNEPASDFTALVHWGDGQTSTLTAGAISANGSGGFDVAGAHTYAEEGTYSISVVVQDSGGATVAATGPAFAVLDALGGLSVSAPPPTVEGSSTGAFTIASFTDGQGNEPASDFSAVVQWGDGQTSTLAAGAISANGSGGFDVVGAHTYAEEGTYAIAVVVQDVGGASVAGSASATVRDAPLNNLILQSPQAGGSQSAALTASFRDANPLAGPGDFVVTVDWADHTSPDILSSAGGQIVFHPQNGTWSFLDSHAFAQPGHYTVSVTVRDVGGASVSGTIPVFLQATSTGGGDNGGHTTDPGGGTTTATTNSHAPAGPVSTNHTAPASGGSSSVVPSPTLPLTSFAADLLSFLQSSAGQQLVSAPSSLAAFTFTPTFLVTGSIALTLAATQSGGDSPDDDAPNTVFVVGLGELSEVGPGGEDGAREAVAGVAGLGDAPLSPIGKTALRVGSTLTETDENVAVFERFLGKPDDKPDAVSRVTGSAETAPAAVVTASEQPPTEPTAARRFLAALRPNALTVCWAAAVVVSLGVVYWRRNSLAGWGKKIVAHFPRALHRKPPV